MLYKTRYNSKSNQLEPQINNCSDKMPSRGTAKTTFIHLNISLNYRNRTYNSICIINILTKKVITNKKTIKPLTKSTLTKCG